MIIAATKDDPPAVRAPRLIAHDDRLTVLTHIPGRRLHDQRHLGDLCRADADRLLDTLGQVTAWQPVPALPEPVDYPAGIAADHAAGLLDDADHVTLHRLLTTATGGTVTAHGDPCRRTCSSMATAPAWSTGIIAAGTLPGYDLAVLYTIGAHAAPTLTHAIIDRVTTAGIDAAFTVNAALLCCRVICGPTVGARL